MSSCHVTSPSPSHSHACIVRAPYTHTSTHARTHDTPATSTTTPFPHHSHPRQHHHHHHHHPSDMSMSTVHPSISHPPHTTHDTRHTTRMHLSPSSKPPASCHHIMLVRNTRRVMRSLSHRHIWLIRTKGQRALVYACSARTGTSHPSPQTCRPPYHVAHPSQLQPISHHITSHHIPIQPISS